MDQTLAKTKKLIENQSKKHTTHIYRKKHTKYYKTYFSTNEYIDGYLNIFDLSDKENALCVTASGDQTFNLINHGIYNIDTFDSNKIAEYYVLGLKRAMILKYSYVEYIDLIKKISSNREFNFSEKIRTVIYDLLPMMDEKYRKFWKEIIDYSYKLQKKYDTHFDIFSLIFFEFTTTSSLKHLNGFLKNEEEFNKLKDGLGKANITYKNANAKDLSRKFKDKSYDLILLSNILDYFYEIYGKKWNYEKLKKYIESLEKITNNNGIIFLNYLFRVDYYLRVKDKEKAFHQIILKPNKNDDFGLIYHSSINMSDLTSEEVYLLTDYERRSSDGILLKRVQK